MGLPAGMAIAPISGLAVARGTGKLPPEATGLFGIACLTTGFTTERMTSVSGLFHARKLSVHLVTTGQDEVAIFALVRIVTREGDTETFNGGHSAHMDAVRALGIVLHDNVDAFGVLLTAGMAAEQKMQAVDHAGAGVEAFCFCGGAPVLMQDARMRWKDLIEGKGESAGRVRDGVGEY